MSLTLLLDLDDTLLGNEINRFIKYYFGALSEALLPYVEPGRMVAGLKQAVAALDAKQTPAGTMEEAFDRVFYPFIGVEKSVLQTTLDNFYAHSFPKLETYTDRRPAAQQIVEYAQQRGWNVVIATNPIFPVMAIEHRLAWAGLPVDRYNFSRVTTYENSHFCKPNPAYYAEILGSLRWPEGPAIMVGNSLSDDILPAETLGMTTFWINPEEPTPQGRSAHSASGSLDDCLSWLRQMDIQAIPAPLQISSQANLAILQSTPAVMDGFARQNNADYWNQRPLPDEWSFTEILCHLRDVDREVNIKRILMFANEKNPFIPGVFTDPWVEERKYAVENGTQALRQFIDVRAELLNLLNGLDGSVWSGAARHAIFGPTTLNELVSFMTTHDRAHVLQAWNALNDVKVV